MNLRARLSHLSNRRQQLTVELEHAREDERRAAVELEAAEGALAEGNGSADDVATWRRQLAATHDRVSTLSGARDRVDEEHNRVARELEIETKRQERERQTKASAQLRAEAARLAESIAAQLAGAVAAVTRRAEILDEIGREFPLAPAPDRLSVTSIAKEAIEAWPRGYWQANAARDVVLRGMEDLVRRVLTGPMIHASSESTQIARRGIDPR